MTGFVFYIVVTVVVVLCSVLSMLRQELTSLNHYQLKLRALRGERKAKVIYPLHMQRYQLVLVFSLLSYISYAIIFLLFREAIGSVFASIIGALVILLVSEIVPVLFLKQQSYSLLAFLAPVIRKLAAIMAPIIRPIARRIEKIQQPDSIQMFTKEELLNSLDRTQGTNHTDMTKDELKMLRGVVGYAQKKVRDSMTPRRMVRIVGLEDEVGPLLMDELHRSGHSRFPVVSDGEHKEFVGTLYLRDLVGQKSLKKVCDIMNADVRYIHEEEALEYALRAFLKLRHHLFIVVNSFEEFVGVLSIEDVLEEIIGAEIVDEFDAHDDLRAVAASVASKERAQRERQSELKK